MKVKSFGWSCVVAALMFGLVGCAPSDPQLAIEKWKASGKTTKIIGMLATTESQSTRILAIRTLAELKATEAYQPLAALFNDEDPVIAHEAVLGIAAIGGPEAEPLPAQGAFHTPSKNPRGDGRGDCRVFLAGDDQGTD